MKTRKMNVQDVTYTVLDTDLLYHIRKFIERVAPTMSDAYLTTLKLNLETLTVKKSYRYMFLHNILEQHQFMMNYNGKKNEILYHPNYIYLIYQELFHVATTKYNKNMIYQGLSEGTKKKKYRGRGFDTGYTLYLTERYFCDENKGEFFGTHRFTKNIMSQLCDLIGHDQVLYCYMNTNLNHFQRYLVNYASDTEVELFTNIMDELKDAEDKNDFVKMGSLNQQALEYVNKFEKMKEKNQIRLIAKK